MCGKITQFSLIFAFFCASTLPGELSPTCIDDEECTCPTGYELVEVDGEKICHLVIDRVTEDELGR